MPQDDLDRAHGGFLGLPVPVVPAALWVAGGVALHGVGSVLVRLAGGHP